MGTCFQISLVAAAMWMTTAEAHGQCRQCGHASQRIHAGRCYPSCTTACRRCALRPLMVGHGRDRRAKDKAIPAIARFHPVPTRPVFEPRRIVPTFAPPVVNVMELPSSMLPRVPSPESVLRRAADEPIQPIESADVPLPLSKPEAAESPESPTQRASYAAPEPFARPAFAWFFLPNAND